MKKLRPKIAALAKRARRVVTRRRLVRAVLALLAAPFVIVGLVAIFTPLPAELNEPAPPSLRVLARDGKLLREVRADDGARARPLPIAASTSTIRISGFRSKSSSWRKTEGFVSRLFSPCCRTW